MINSPLEIIVLNDTTKIYQICIRDASRECGLHIDNITDISSENLLAVEQDHTRVSCKQRSNTRLTSSVLILRLSIFNIDLQAT